MSIVLAYGVMNGSIICESIVFWIFTICAIICIVKSTKYIINHHKEKKEKARKKRINKLWKENRNVMDQNKDFLNHLNK